MGFRFWRRVRIAPGVTLNLSKSGGSLSFGPRGAKFTIGPRGSRATVGLPGTGLFYTTSISPGKQRSGTSRTAAPVVSRKGRLSLGFFKRLVTPDDEEALVDGCRELIGGDENAAYSHFQKAAHLADGAFMAGFIALKKSLAAEAEHYLDAAAKNEKHLGKHFSKYGIDAAMSLPITDEVSAHVGPNLRGVLLALVEVYQRQSRFEKAIQTLKRLLRLSPDDVVVKVSLAELLLDANPGDKGTLQQVVKLAEGVENESQMHAALLLYKGKALRELGLLTAARDVLSAALRKKKGRAEELLSAIRYERALVYEQMGRHKTARSELEKIYAVHPDFEDVAARLGL